LSENYYAVIMAGGGGTRLWPVSRKSRPKQFLKLSGERTMFELAVDRLAPLFPPERILVVTVEEQAGGLRAVRESIPAENFLLEPIPRGTASVVGLAAIHLRRRDPGARMAILTADHYIRDESRFQEVLAAAGELARASYLVTLGITPTYPATGYGYIEQGQSLGLFAGYEAYAALKFTEKPDGELAGNIWNDGLHTWNSGMFVWNAETILAEIERQMPGLHSILEEIDASVETGGGDNGHLVSSTVSAIERLWPRLEAKSIDYGVMEGAERVAVVPTGDLGWTDVGSWETLMGLLEADEHGNVVAGADHIAIDTGGTLVRVERYSGSRLVGTIGLEDMVVVDTPDVLLICPRSRSQEVRRIVALLQERPGGEAFL